MDRLKATLLTAFLISILLTPTASAQATAQSVQIISGNGQLICPTCAFKINTFFYPMVVKVTDVNGNPIAGKTVNWQQVSFNGGSMPVFNATTTTDSNGLSLNLLSQGFQFGSIGISLSAKRDHRHRRYRQCHFYGDPGAHGSRFQRAARLFTAYCSDRSAADGTCRQHRHQSHPVHIDARGMPIPNVSLRLLK